MSDFQIIRTQEELEALDPDSILVTEDGIVRKPQGIRIWLELSGLLYLPAAVITTGTQVRAAREAMEKDND